MPQTDAYGNFVPSIGPPGPNTINDYRTILHSVGAPSDADGNDGDLNVDDAGNVYSKANGTWTLVTGGGGGGVGALYRGNGDPNGAITPTASAALFVQNDSTPPYQMWVWNGSTWL